MYGKQIILLGLAITLPATHAHPSLVPRDGQLVCQSTGGSPLTEDVTGVINQLKGKSGSTCAGSDGCKVVATQGTADIAVCGTNNNWGCGTVAGYAEQIQGCPMSGNQVGGILFVGDASVEVRHSGKQS